MAECCLFWFVDRCNFKVITLLFIIAACSSFKLTHGKVLQMKVVDEPTNYGLNLQQNNAINSPPLLTARVKPSNFSGPPHLQRLVGSCFSKISNSYKYEFCPFDNVTQHEQTLRWNPFHGVLGVWHEWVIDNNTFVAMTMTDGDPCGSEYRTTKVVLVCGNTSDIDSIAEPTTCNYILKFITPLVCHPDSMLVYPTLRLELQDQWDETEGLLEHGHITTQGYQKRLNAIFTAAGYKIAPEERRRLQELERRREETENNRGVFESLRDCQASYGALLNRIAELNSLLAAHGITSTNATQRVSSTPSDVDDIDDDT